MASKRSTPGIMQRARELRKESTTAESKLWAYLRMLRTEGINFRRQHAIGLYIADFAAPRKRLIIEVDGSPHGEQKEYDAERTAFFKSKDYRVLRFWDREVMKKMDDVMRVILEELERSKP
jgi:very-short-patch-repair endonuclease